MEPETSSPPAVSAPTTVVASSPIASPSKASHSFPPTPPSSCDGHSPSPKSPQNPRTLSTSPIVMHNSPPNNVPPPKPALSFSIENILRPDFGTNNKTRQTSFIPLSPESVFRTPPKTPELNCPVDLSQKTCADKTSAVNITSKASIATENKSTETYTTVSSGNSRVRYPDNPEELANPQIPPDEVTWPAWVYCTRYSDRPSSGPRSRRMKTREKNPEEKRPRTAFTSEQLSKLKQEFDSNKYLDDKRRQALARDLHLNESQIKIWFQNKRAKDKKTGGNKSGLAQQLMAQGLYNHSTMPVDEDDPFLS